MWAKDRLELRLPPGKKQSRSEVVFEYGPRGLGGSEKGSHPINVAGATRIM